MILPVHVQRPRGHQKIMENPVRIFRIDFMLNIFVLIFISAEVIGAPSNQTIIDVMKKDTNLCKSAEYFYKLDYAQPCLALEYPTIPWHKVKNEIKDMYLCLIIYDTAYKICKYSDYLPFPVNSTEMINSYIKTFAQKESEVIAPIIQDKFCKDHIQGFTPAYSKVAAIWKPRININVNDSYGCKRICFDDYKCFNPLCAIFAWSKSIDDSINKITTIANQSSVTSDIKSDHQTDDKESQVKVQESKQNVSNSVLYEHTQANIENVQPDTEKVNKVESPKKLNDSTPETQVHTTHEEAKVNTVIIKDKTSIEAPKTSDNVPNEEIVNSKKIGKKGNIEESDKNDVKTTTISENTQEHYDANVEEDMDSNIGNTEEEYDQGQQTGDAVGNQYEKTQGAYEQKHNVPYPDRRTGDDSHFFTYFTVISVACIAGYIGYHNKQKILAIVLEGRRSRNSRSRRRPSTASYRKLDCTLEEAVTSQCNANVTHVIY